MVRKILHLINKYSQCVAVNCKKVVRKIFGRYLRFDLNIPYIKLGF